VSLPLCYTGYILKKVGLLVEFKVLFIESFCRSHYISLTGKLLQPIADKFIVLWPKLEEKGKREYLGKIL